MGEGVGDGVKDDVAVGIGFEFWVFRKMKAAESEAESIFEFVAVLADANGEFTGSFAENGAEFEEVAWGGDFEVVFAGGKVSDFVADCFEEHGFVGGVFWRIFERFFEEFEGGGLGSLGGEEFAAVVSFFDVLVGDFFDGGGWCVADDGGAVFLGGFDNGGDFFVRDERVGGVVNED